MAKSEEKVVLSTMWSAGCGSHGGCGCEIYVKDGKVTKVEGDRNHPFITRAGSVPRVWRYRSICTTPTV